MFETYHEQRNTKSMMYMGKIDTILVIFGALVLLYLQYNKGQLLSCTLSSLPASETWQSSTYEGTFIQQLIAILMGYQSPFSANNGVNGKSVSGAISGACAQTKSEVNPWWQTKLDDSYYMTAVEIIVPETCDTCPEDFKLENILVEIGEVSLDYTSEGWIEEWNTGKQNCSFFSTAVDDLRVVVNCSKPLFGNFVRLTKLDIGETTLSLCEVDIIGYRNCTINPSVSSIVDSTSSVDTGYLSSLVKVLYTAHVIPSTSATIRPSISSAFLTSFTTGDFSRSQTFVSSVSSNSEYSTLSSEKFQLLTSISLLTAVSFSGVISSPRLEKMSSTVSSNPQSHTYNLLSKPAGTMTSTLQPSFSEVQSASLGTSSQSFISSHILTTYFSTSAEYLETLTSLSDYVEDTTGSPTKAVSSTSKAQISASPSSTVLTTSLSQELGSQLPPSSSKQSSTISLLAQSSISSTVLVPTLSSLSSTVSVPSLSSTSSMVSVPTLSSISSTMVSVSNLSSISSTVSVSSLSSMSSLVSVPTLSSISSTIVSAPTLSSVSSTVSVSSLSSMSSMFSRPTQSSISSTIVSVPTFSSISSTVPASSLSSTSSVISMPTLSSVSSTMIFVHTLTSKSSTIFMSTLPSVYTIDLMPTLSSISATVSLQTLSSLSSTVYMPTLSSISSTIFMPTLTSISLAVSKPTPSSISSTTSMTLLSSISSTGHVPKLSSINSTVSMPTQFFISSTGYMPTLSSIFSTVSMPELSSISSTVSIPTTYSIFSTVSIPTRTSLSDRFPSSYFTTSSTDIYPSFSVTAGTFAAIPSSAFETAFTVSSTTSVTRITTPSSASFPAFTISSMTSVPSLTISPTTFVSTVTIYSTINSQAALTTSADGSVISSATKISTSLAINNALSNLSRTLRTSFKSITSTPALALWISSRFTMSPTSHLNSTTLVPETISILSEPATSTTAVISTVQKTSSLVTKVSFLSKSTMLKAHVSSTQLISSSSVIVSQQSSVMPVWCTCTCEQAELISNLTSNNKTTEQVTEEIKEALTELTVDSKKTTVNERKLVSVDDKRGSAKLVGTVGVVFCATILVLVVLSDLPMMIVGIKRVVGR